MPNTFRNKEIARKAGAKSKRGKSQKTAEWLALRESILNRHTARFDEVLNTLQGMEFVKAYLEVLKYFKPRLNSIEVEQVDPPEPPLPLPYDISRLHQMTDKELINEIKLLENGNDEKENVSQ